MWKSGKLNEEKFGCETKKENQREKQNEKAVERKQAAFPNDKEKGTTTRSLSSQNFNHISNKETSSIRFY
jgi:hypothetical protein